MGGKGIVVVGAELERRDWSVTDRQSFEIPAAD
jgi:hypothetical protein